MTNRCEGYCGVACVDGHCPIALYNEDFTMFEKKPSCEDCFYYKGCEDCCFYGDIDYCPHAGESEVTDNER